MNNMTLNEVISILEKIVDSYNFQPKEDEAIRRAILYLFKPMDAAVEKLSCGDAIKIRLIDLDKLMDHPWMRNQFSENANGHFIYGWMSCKEWIEKQSIVEIGL